MTDREAPPIMVTMTWTNEAARWPRPARRGGRRSELRSPWRGIRMVLRDMREELES
jgi:hypothetical protein